MSKKREAPTFHSYLKCTGCNHVTVVNIVPFSVVKSGRRLVCSCEEYSAVSISEGEGLDALARQHVEGRSAA
jgi:transcription elongation factor Elf1